MAYHHDQHLYKRQKRSRRLAHVSLVLILIIIGAGIAVVIDQVFNKSMSVESDGTGAQAKVQSSTINIFRTPYFQFQADRNWREVIDETNNQKFTYRRYNDFLVEHELVVEVDEIQDIVLDNENTTRVYPVTIENNLLKPVVGISKHCKTMIEDDEDFVNRPQRVEYMETSFPCVPDGVSFRVVAGLVGNDEIIEHTNPDGIKRRYKITYQDSTFSPNGSPLNGIIRSFQLL